MLKILQAGLQQYMEREIPDIQAGLRKGRGTRHQIDNIHWIIEKSREFQKNICFIDYAKDFDCVDHKKTVENSERDGNTRPPYLPLEKSICMLRSTVRTRHGAKGWFQIGNGVHQGCILLPCLFNFYAEYITWNAGLDDSQAGMEIAGRNIVNLRYAGDTTLMPESEEELKSLLLNVRGEWQSWLKTQHSEN